MTVGERLREARERQKVSLHAIAEKTNISVRALEAIEKGQFGKLPGGIFTRGFIRSYAAQVGIDPDAAVAQFLSDEPGAREESDDGGTREREGLGLLAIVAGGLIVVALTLALIYFFAPDWLRLGGGAPASVKEATVPESSPATTQAAVTDSVPAPPVPTAAAPTDAPPAPMATPPVTPAAQVPPAQETPKAPLHLVVAPTGRCWVQVSADGQMRVARELNVGERVTVEAAERLHIVVGDAGAFAYELNGRAGRSLGAAGGVARVTIQPATVSQFQVP